MKFSTLLPVAALAATEVAAHATFQQLWVNGVDYAGTCVRRPNSNSPVENVQSANIVCNANSGPAASKCPVPAGGTVTVEIHQVCSSTSLHSGVETLSEEWLIMKLL